MPGYLTCDILKKVTEGEGRRMALLRKLKNIQSTNLCRAGKSRRGRLFRLLCLGAVLLTLLLCAQERESVLFSLPLTVSQMQPFGRTSYRAADNTQGVRLAAAQEPAAGHGTGLWNLKQLRELKLLLLLLAGVVLFGCRALADWPDPDKRTHPAAIRILLVRNRKDGKKRNHF